MHQIQSHQPVASLTRQPNAAVGSSREVWQIGRILHDRAESEGKKIAIEVSRPGQQLFYCVMPGIAPDSTAWIRRKRNVVERFHKSSLLMALLSEQSQRNMHQRYSLNPDDYGATGGGVPVVVTGSGCIGCVTVSGMTQFDDHFWAVEAIQSVLAKMGPKRVYYTSRTHAGGAIVSSAGSFLRETFEGMSSGSKGLAVLIRAYFDESYDSNDRSGVFTVSGYVFTNSKLKALEKAWKRMLARYELRYFHMAECNASDPLKPDNVFAHLSEAKRIACATEAIKIARENTLHGHVCVLNQGDYQSILQDRGFYCDSYSFLLWTTLIQMGKWRDQNRPNDNLTLFFEQGYDHQGRANELLQCVSQDRQFRESLGLTSHAFFNKDQSYPGQAADLIAWQIRKLYSNLGAARPVRKDTAALLDGTIVKTIRYDPVQLHILHDQFVRHAGSLERAARIMFNPDGPLYHGA